MDQTWRLKPEWESRKDLKPTIFFPWMSEEGRGCPKETFPRSIRYLALTFLWGYNSILWRQRKKIRGLLLRKTPRIMAGRPALRACGLVFWHRSSSVKLDLVHQANCGSSSFPYDQTAVLTRSICVRLEFFPKGFLVIVSLGSYNNPCYAGNSSPGQSAWFTHRRKVCPGWRSQTTSQLVSQTSELVLPSKSTWPSEAFIKQCPH